MIALPSLKKVYETIELPLLPVLARIEQCGVLINADQLQQQSQELANRIEAIENETYVLAGKTFNLGSPKQLQEILYGDLKLPVLEKTPKGQPSTGRSTTKLSRKISLAQAYFGISKFI